MRLKGYQEQALDRLSRYLASLRKVEVARAGELAHIKELPAETREKVLEMLGDPVADAWKDAQAAGIVASPDSWRELKDGLGRLIPHVCLKLPTGGGKTLLAAHGIDRIMVSHFRQATGFVLWIVPSEAIYRQTKAQLADRGHPIRQALDRASAGRVKVLEKLDGFTRQDVAQRLCVLLLMLQSTGRRDRETLKVFRDSGSYMSFFPQDDPPALAALLQEVPNLEALDLAEAAAGEPGAEWIKQSLGNTLRLIRPVVVLDEGHRAYSETARSTLASLNPRFLLELTATPDRRQSNVLVDVSGRDLKDEEMIKLPIRLEVGENVSWKDTLRDAVDRLNELEKAARSFETQSGRYIRPILLVRVDRTGRDQRGGDYVHSEDVVEFLTHNVGTPPEAIRRQTAEIKELKGDDLMSPYSKVRVIITKDALREGWDCPFAYVLAILSRGTAQTALTQMIGRVLRQPHAMRTGVQALDEAHVFCADVAVGEAVQRIKAGLEAEGMGDLGADIVTTGGGKSESELKTIRLRNGFRGSRIMVPRVLRRTEDGYRDLDYEADIIADVDFQSFAYRKAESVSITDYDVGGRRTIEVDIANGHSFELAHEEMSRKHLVEERLDLPTLIRRMLDVVPNPWQAARILDDALEVLRKRAGEEELIAARYTLIDHMKRDLQAQLEEAAERGFREKVSDGEIVFKLISAPLDKLNFEFEEYFTTHIAFGDASAPLLHNAGTPLERSLYETALRKDVNGFERDVALYLDSKEAVTWWWRIAARRDWGLQGWMRNRVYPDFLVKLDTDGETTRLLVLETKGKHLAGSQDTEFKSKFFELLEEAYRVGREAGEVELFADAPNAMRFRILLEEKAWKADLQSVLD